MSRKKRASKREVMPDLKLNDKRITMFINKMMYAGKRSVARNILYDTLDFIKEKTKEDPMATFGRALENVRPLLEVKSRRVGGATYQVPVEVRPDRGVSIAIKWLIEYARGRSGRSMVERLASEIIEAAKGEGSAIKKREDTHKMAEANKAFAHYRW
jgi:small subunit ribosomal protein S7